MKIYFKYLLLSILTAIISCSTEIEQKDITYQLKLGEFIHEVTETGVLAAKKSVSINTPSLRIDPPKVLRLLPEGSTVRKDDIVAILESQQILTQHVNATEELEIAKAEFEQRKAELTMERLNLESQIQNAEASVEASRLQLERIRFEPANKQELMKLEIQKVELNLKKDRQKLISLRKIQQAEEKRLQLKIEQAQHKLDQAIEYLGELTIKSPVNGFIIYEYNWYTDEKVAEGDMVYPGEPIVTIPDISIMQVTLQMNETDAQKVKKGQPANIQISSNDNLILKGQVVDKAKMAKEVHRRSMVKKVEVIIEIDSTDVKLSPGINALCSIQIDKMDSVISVPYECLFDKDSLKVVYVQEQNIYVPYAVDVLHHTNNHAIINSYLKGTEQCALNEPPSDKIKWSDSLKTPKIQKDTTQQIEEEPEVKDNLPSHIELQLK